MTDTGRARVPIGFWRAVVCAGAICVLAGGASDQTDAAARWPLLAAIVQEWAPPGQEYEGYVCSAVSLGADIVATAAHCVTGAGGLDVVLGGADLCGAAPVALRRHVTAVEAHPRFDPLTLSHDLALLRLSPAATTRAPGPVLADAFAGVHGTVAGYGPSQWAGARPCRPAHRPVVILPATACPSRPAATLCVAGRSQTGQDACPGASGAPILGGTHRRPVLLGLVSSGLGCGSTTNPSHYTDTAALRDWVQGAINSR